MPSLSTTVMCVQKQSKTIMKISVTCDVYKSTYVEYPYYSTAKTNENKNLQEYHEMIYFKTVNKLIMTSATTPPQPYLQPSKNLRRKQIRMYVLNMDHIKFTITPKYKYRYQ